MGEDRFDVAQPGEGLSDRGRVDIDLHRRSLDHLRAHDDPPADRAAFVSWLVERRNDLAEAACALEPTIALVLDRIGECGDCLLARMSGSGPTCYGLFDTSDAAAAAAAAIASAEPGWWVQAAPVLRTPPPITAMSA